MRFTYIGTSHFYNLDAAVTYYKPYGFDAPEVRRKLADGEIHIGPPPAAEGETVQLRLPEFRYVLEVISE
tara:strand:+ start:624 stop:833 length:210 start_codon:yes stop_codon:yes gene_type:complete